jgi:hypothetical protein
MIRRTWSIWAKALGPRVSQDDAEADLAAVIRSVKFLAELFTCIFIVAGVVRHWNN